MIVRFTEAQRYDIRQDAEVTLFMASTDHGSYHMERQCATSRVLRDTRNAFKERVMDLMQAGKAPCEVRLV